MYMPRWLCLIAQQSMIPARRLSPYLQIACYHSHVISVIIKRTPRCVQLRTLHLITFSLSSFMLVSCHKQALDISNTIRLECCRERNWMGLVIVRNLEWPFADIQDTRSHWEHFSFNSWNITSYFISI